MVDSVDLHEEFCDDTVLVLVYRSRAICVAFDAENPFSANNILVGSACDCDPGPSLPQCFHLAIHCFLPAGPVGVRWRFMKRLRVAGGFLYINCHLLIEINVESEISMVIIRAEV